MRLNRPFHRPDTHKCRKLIQFPEMSGVEVFELFCRFGLDQFVNVKTVLCQWGETFAEWPPEAVHFDGFSESFPRTFNMFNLEVAVRLEKSIIEKRMFDGNHECTPGF